MFVRISIVILLRLRKPNYDARAFFDNASVQRRHIVYNNKLAIRQLLTLFGSVTSSLDKCEQYCQIQLFSLYRWLDYAIFMRYDEIS